MNKIRIVIVLSLFITSCSIWGPYPKEDKYKYAVSTIPNYNETVYVLYGVFWKNAFVEDPSYSVPKKGTLCSLFIMNDKLLFAIYDKKNLFFHPIDITNFSDIKSASVQKNMTGIRRTLRYHKNDGKTNSFGFTYSYESNGTEVEEDTALDFIFNKIKKQ